MSTTRKKRGAWCAAPNCNSVRKDGVRLFGFPIEEERCKRWVLNCGRSDLVGKTASYLRANCYICSFHFEPSQFMNPTNPYCRLVWSAVPTLFEAPRPHKRFSMKIKLKETEVPLKRRRKGKETVNHDTHVTDEDATSCDGVSRPAEPSGPSSCALVHVKQEIP